MFSTLLTTLTTLMLSSLSAQASHRTVKVDSFSVAGSACQPGTVSTTANPVTGNYAVLPENFAAALTNGASLDRKSCSFAIAFQGTPHRAVRLTFPRIKGDVALDQNATAEINYEVFFAGQRGDKSTLSFTGTQGILEQSFDEINEEPEVVFACGQSGIARGNASILVNSNPAGSQVAVAHVEKIGVKIDSIPCL